MGSLAELQSGKSLIRTDLAVKGRGKTPIATKVENAPKENFAANVAKQAGNLTSKVLYETGKFVVNTPRYVYEGVKTPLTKVANAVTGEYDRELDSINRHRDQLDSSVELASRQYKSGKMSKENYSRVLRETSQAYQELSNRSKAIEDENNKALHDVPLEFANLAATVLTAGRLQVAKGAAASVVRGATTAAVPTATRNKVFQTLVQQEASKIEKAIIKVPAVKDLVYRNMAYFGKRDAQQLAGETASQWLGRNSKEVAINFLLKRPIVYEMNIKGGQEVYDKIIEGDYGNAAKQSAWMATQMLSGGPLGAATRGFSWLRKSSGKAAYGESAFIDELGKASGTREARQYVDYLSDLKKTDPEKFKEAEKVLRIVAAANLHMTDGDARAAAARVLDHWDQYGIDLTTVSPEKAVGLLKNWADSHQLLTAGIKAGVVPEGAVVARWDVAARKALASNLEAAGDDFQALTDIYRSWALAPGNAAAQNSILTERIEQVINDAFRAGGGGAKKVAEEIRNMNAASIIPGSIPKELKNALSKMGFVVAVPSKVAGKTTPNVDYNDTKKLITAVQHGDSEIFDIATEPQPTLNFFARALERLGVSPTESNATANRVLSQQVVADLTEVSKKLGLGIDNGPNSDSIAAGQVILSKLQRGIESMQPSRFGNIFVGNRAVGSAAHDIRQLRIGEIERFTGFNKEQSKAIYNAIVDAYTKVPMEYRGLGNKIVDNLYKIPGNKHYSRIQGALRYTYNPFFKAQERTETFLLSRAQARTGLWAVNGMTRQDLTDGAKLLDESGIFKTGLSGEAAQDLILGRITANITQAQKRDLAGLATVMARQRNMSLQEMLQRHPQDVEDALRVVVQYPNKGVLNSSLARTMNIAFFPSRYNAKVTLLAAQILAKEPPTVQLAVLNSLFNMRDWLKSEEGIQWQSDNAEVLGVLNWLTPVGSIKYGLETLTHKPDSIGELGSLGGLPLGVITQMLDSQGIITLNTPYFDKKTGDVLPRYIPESTKARAATAVGDLVNSMFTYPGRTLGLPGKNQQIKKAIDIFIDTNGKDFEKRVDTQRLTPLQQRWIDVIKSNGEDEEAIDALYNAPAEGQFDWYTIPTLDIPVKTPYEGSPAVARRTNLPTKASQKKGKREKNYALPIAPK